MPLNSVNTNTGAMIALQSLNSTTTELATTQARINTGRKINDAKDNAAIWAIAQGQRGEVSSYGAVKESLQRGQSAIDVALSAGEAVSDNLTKMKTLALSASDKNLDVASRQALQEQYNSAAQAIKKFVQNASFNGVNLLDNSSTNGYSALANTKGTTTVNVGSENFLFQATAGTAAKITSGTVGAITQASSFSIALDGGTATTINIAKGDTAAGIAKKVNDTLGVNVASVNDSGALVFQSNNYGGLATESRIALVGISGDTAAAAAAAVAGPPAVAAQVAIETTLGFASTELDTETGVTASSVQGTGAGRLQGIMQIREAETFTSTFDYGTLLKQLDDSLASVNKAVGRLGSGSKTMEAQLNFVSKLSDTLEAGIGNLVDADLAKESARLQALQTKQQLGVQALSIANQSTGVLLSLFR